MSATSRRIRSTRHHRRSPSSHGCVADAEAGLCYLTGGPPAAMLSTFYDAPTRRQVRPLSSYASRLIARRRLTVLSASELDVTDLINSVSKSHKSTAICSVVCGLAFYSATFWISPFRARDMVGTYRRTDPQLRLMPPLWRRVQNMKF